MAERIWAAKVISKENGYATTAEMRSNFLLDVWAQNRHIHHYSNIKVAGFFFCDTVIIVTYYV